MREIHLNKIDSTNTYAKGHSKTFAKDAITCIIAEEQTSGRGRFQRNWSSPIGNIYATFYFQLPSNTPHLIALAQIMALSLAKVLMDEGFKPKIKWPNDIQLNGKKVSGILCETQFSKDFVDVFLGIGVNVNLKLEQTTNIDQPATSLAIETGNKWDKAKLLKQLQNQFAKDLELFKRKGFTPFHEEFENLLALKGQEIRCFDGKKTWTGICHSISEDGQLNLLLPDKSLHKILSGDITLSSQDGFG